MRSLFIACLLPTLALAQADWRGFRGTDARAQTATATPRIWSSDANLAWRLALPGPGTSSPIVVGDAVFVTCWTGYGLDRKAPGDRQKLRRHLLKVARKTGTIVWQKTVGPVPTEDEFGGRMATHGYASSTPVSDGKRVYVFFGKSGVFAYELDGSLAWQADAGKSSSKWTTGSGTSPALCGDLLFVNASDESQSLIAFRRSDGKEVWRRSAEAFDQAYTMPLVVRRETAEPTLLFGMLGALWGLEPATGKNRWTVRTKTNGALAPSLIATDDTLYAFGGQTKVRSHAVRLGGRGDVTDSHIAWTSRYGSYVTTPLLFDGHLYWVNEGGIVYCADAKTGELIFKERFPKSTFYASPVLAKDAIYFVSRESGTFVIEAKPKFRRLACNVFEDDETTFDATPALSGGAIFLRSRAALYCIATRQPGGKR